MTLRCLAGAVVLCLAALGAGGASAAEQGDVTQGDLHRQRGEFALAAEWYEKAAAAGDPEGLLWLGLLTMRGIDGVPADAVRGYALLAAARASRAPEAEEVRRQAAVVLGVMAREMELPQLAAALAAARRLVPGEAAAAVPAKAPPAQDWRQRRLRFRDLVRRLEDSGYQDEPAQAEVLATLQAFSDDPLAWTPMEAMELLGRFRQAAGEAQLAQLFTELAAFAALGWYDALRFADDAGRADIRDNQDFFHLAFRLGGEDGAGRAADFMKNHSAEAAAAVREGIGLAASLRGEVAYDMRWPAHYGPSRGRVEALPPEQWDAAWEKAAAVVEHAYRQRD